MRLVGYSDKLSVEPGEIIRFMISSEYPKYHADLVRLKHTDDANESGLKEVPFQSSINGEFKGRIQTYPKGSYIIFPEDKLLRSLPNLTLQAWIFPTTPSKGRQAILGNWNNSSGPGYGIFVDEAGCLAVGIKDKVGNTGWLNSGRPLLRSTWYFIAATYSSTTHKLWLTQEPIERWPEDDTRVSVERQVQIGPIGDCENSFLISANWETTAGNTVSGFFNGKIDRPRVFSRAFDAKEIADLKTATLSEEFKKYLVAGWDFSLDIPTTRATDISPNMIHGRTVNSPKRAVTGFNWSGKENNFQYRPSEYGAIHFHDDDLEDADWEVDFEFQVPENFKSGVYAARLQSGGDKDCIPFFVRPKKGQPKSKILFLAPTLSYLAYANAHTLSVPEDRVSNFQELQDPVRRIDRYFKYEFRHFRYPFNRIDGYIDQTGLLSIYDDHSDGSGVCYASRLRPLLSIRPEYKEAVQNNGHGALHEFSADLCLLDWLEAKGYDFDIVTDEDLHFEGAELLGHYKVVVTGTHPEYWTEAMLNAMEAYLNKGGRLMYLGGNGFYWVTSIDPTRPHIIEVRRWGGTQTWRSEPGELYHSTTGEFGGLWRNRGRAPQKLVGVGHTAVGFDRGMPYRRLPDSFNPKAAFIFEGIGNEETIGNFDNVIMTFAAGGYEIDRFDHALGTPHHALLLASASGFSNSYFHAADEIDHSNPNECGEISPLVRADMVYFEYPNGGAVFSVGSIIYCGCLFYNHYDNNVSRITANVLTKFTSDKLA